jgi:hypothetical protein
MRDIFRKLYTQHKSNAKQRGVLFLITLDQWKQVWLDSGKWDQRGRGAAKYCMCRIGDTGAYEVGNVFIDTNRRNVSDGNIGKACSDEHKAKISAANLGQPHPWSVGASNPMHRSEVKAKLSAAVSGIKHYKSIGVTTPTGFYGCAREAAKAMGMKKPTVEWRARHNKFGFSYGQTA